jgi:uncharacterized membrane protein
MAIATLGYVILIISAIITGVITIAIAFKQFDNFAENEPVQVGALGIMGIGIYLIAILWWAAWYTYPFTIWALT